MHEGLESYWQHIAGADDKIDINELTTVMDGFGVDSSSSY